MGSVSYCSGTSSNYACLVDAINIKRHCKCAHDFSGAEYIGELKDYKKHGTGTYKWKSETSFAAMVYEGEYENEKKHGKGKLTVTCTSSDCVCLVGEPVTRHSRSRMVAKP